MRTIIEQVYNRLSTDPILLSMLAQDQWGLPAIYHEWGEREKGPYLVMTWLGFTITSDDQAQGFLQIDLFDRTTPTGSTSYGPLMDIRDRVVHLLDRYRAGAGVTNTRLFHDNEQQMPSDSGRMRRYRVDFQVFYTRTLDI